MAFAAVQIVYFMVEGFYFVIMKRFPYKFENFSAGILKLGTSESAADIVKMPICRAPPSQSFWFSRSVWGPGTWIFNQEADATVLGPYFENHLFRMRVCDPVGITTVPAFLSVLRVAIDLFTSRVWDFRVLMIKRPKIIGTKFITPYYSIFLHRFLKVLNIHKQESAFQQV